MQRILRTFFNQLTLLALLIAFICALIALNLQNVSQFNFGLGIVLAVILLLWLSPLTLKSLMGLNRLNRFWFVAVVIIGYQLILLVSLSEQFGYDAATVMQTAMGHANYYYFSINPNNLNLLFLEHGLYVISQALKFHNFLVVLNVVNLIFVDIAVALVALTLKRHLSRKIRWSIIPFSFLLAPWIMVFYSDTVVLPLIALELFALHNLITQNASASNAQLKLIGSGVLLGFSAFFAYSFKPSTIILTIAIVIELLISLLFPFNKATLTAKIKNRMTLISAVTVLASFGLAMGVTQIYTSQQHIMFVNKKGALQPSHFILMGMNSQSGGRFSGADYDYSLKHAQTPATQNRANYALIKKRLTNFGVMGYLKFLIEKNYHNTSDGTLGWSDDNQFSEPALTPHAFVRSFFYQEGSRRSIYFVAAQLVWISIMFGTLFSLFDSSLFARILRLSVLGTLLFLLIFEGGRSRYLIQAFPMIYMLSIIGWTQLITYLKNQQSVTANLTQFSAALRHAMLK